MSARLSIIMPVLNRAGFVGRAIQSANDQKLDGIEIIVVDGGSTDGTQDVVLSLPNVQLLHAPKSSIYEALNIGIRAARAPLIGHLNSDDRIPKGALETVLAAAAEDEAADIIRGAASFVARDESGVETLLPKAANDVSPELRLRMVLFGSPAINSCYVRASTYRRIGLYDETLRIAADREWLLRAVLSGVQTHLLRTPVYEYLVHAGSLTLGARRGYETAYIREHLRIAERYIAQVQSVETSRRLRLWHAQEMIRLLVRTPGAFGQELNGAFETSRGWPLYAIGALARFAKTRINRAWRH